MEPDSDIKRSLQRCRLFFALDFLVDEPRPLNVINLRFLRKKRLQPQHEQPMVLTRFKPRRVMLQRFPAHDQVEALRCFNALGKHMAQVALRTAEQWRHLGKIAASWMS